MTTIADLAGDYTLDATHSSIGFSVRHAMVSKVRGDFKEISGKAVVTGDKAHVEVEAKIDSVSTNNADRDQHLLASDFFDQANHPTLKFVSDDVAFVDDETLRVNGELTMRGVTKPVSIDFDYNGKAVDPYGLTRLGFEGKTELNRKDFGMQFDAKMEAGGLLVGEKITVSIDAEFVKNEQSA